MNWYPRKRFGLLFGLGLLLVLLLADLLLARRLLGMPVNGLLYRRALLLLATAPLLIFLAHACYALRTLTYRVERNGIAIRWGLGRDMIPMGAIEEIVPCAQHCLQLTSGVGWPGYRIGQVWLEGIGPVRLYATGQPEQGLLVRTADRSYLITPANADGFLADYRARRTLGPIAQWRQGWRLPGLLGLSIWRDRLATGLLALGALVNLGLFGFLAGRYPFLPARLILGFGPDGLGNRIGLRRELLIMAAIALGILGLNGILAAWAHRRQRVLALLLAGNVPLVQALVWMAVARLLG